MKWGGYNMNAGEKLDKVFGKLASRKGIYYLLSIIALGLVLGAGWKWHP